MLVQDKFQVQQCQINNTSSVYLMPEIEEYQLDYLNPFELSQASVLPAAVFLIVQ